MHRHHHAQESVDRFQLFANQTKRNVVEAGAAILFGNADTEQVQRAHFFQYFGVSLLFLIPLFDVRRHFFPRKLAHGLHQRLVIFGQLEFNHVRLSLEFRVNNDRTS